MSDQDATLPDQYWQNIQRYLALTAEADAIRDKLRAAGIAWYIEDGMTPAEAAAAADRALPARECIQAELGIFAEADAETEGLRPKVLVADIALLMEGA